MRITWAKALAARACQLGIDRVLTQAGRTLESLKPGSWIDIEDISDAGDAIWCLSVVRPDLGRLLAADCAERALIRRAQAGRTTDPRSWAAISIARAYVHGLATSDELRAASAGEAFAAYASSAYASSAYASAASAAYAATSSAAYAAYVATSVATERHWQLVRLRQYCRGEAPGKGIEECEAEVRT